MTDHVTDEQLSLLIDGELSLTAREAVGNHVRRCPTCASRHDALVAAVAALRLSTTLEWRDEATDRVWSRLAPRGERNLALPIAVVLAALALALAAPYLTVVSAAVTIAGAIARAVGSFLPTVGGNSASTVAALVAFAVFGPLLSLRLARRR